MWASDCIIDNVCLSDCIIDNVCLSDCICILAILVYYSEDDAAELLRELQKIKKERAEEQAKKVH